MNEFPLNHVRMWPFQTGIPCHFIIRRRRSLRVTLSPPPISFCWSQPREVLYKHGKTMLVIRPASIRLYTVFLWPTAHFPIPILFYFDANRGLPWLCPGSFSSVRLMLSICDNKFAPIPSRENMHLFPFELSFLCSPFPWLSLTVVYVSSFDFASCVFFDCTCIFSRLSWHDYFARRALFVGDRLRYSIPCVCARVSIPIWCSIGQRLISTG